MGPDIPNRPKFSWDFKSAPWTDAKGPQEGYYNSVKLWKSFQDALPESNPNKIPPALQGMILKSQLYGRATNLAKKVSDEDLQSENGAMEIARCIYRLDPLSVINETYQKFSMVLNTVRGTSESYKNFEQRFDSNVCNYNSTAPSSQLPEAILAFVLLSNANIDDNQRVSVLSASAPKAEDADDLDVRQILDKITYEDVASIIRSLDKPKSDTVPSYPVASVTANSASAKFERYKGRNTRRMTQNDIKELKRKTSCKDCNEVGHWAGDDECHADNGSNTPKTAIRTERSPPPEHNKSKRTVTFHMAMLTNQDLGINSNLVLVDDGAPYAGMGLFELEKLARIIMPGWDGALGALPDTIKARPFWQYGRGKHASKARRILGTVMLTIDSDQGDALSINHLVIEGSSPWVVGRNVTTKGNIIHANGDYLQFFQPDGNELTLDLIEHDMHSYLPRSKFYHDAYISTHDPTSAALCNSSVTMNWKDTKNIIDRVHAHVCGHSNYNDISLLLKRNQLWDDHCVDYLSKLLETCPHCHVVDAPAGRRPVSLSTISREFNDTVAVDHYHLDGLDIFHCMDVSTRYSAGAVVDSTAIHDAIEEFETTWINPFWSPGAVQGDKAFDNATFRGYLQAHDIDFRPVPPRRHNKNAIESKHRILRDIYMRLKHANPAISPKLLIAQSLRISNDLYGNDVASANELAKGYTRPIVHGTLIQLPEEVRVAHDELLAKRKLNLILRSNAVRDKPLSVGDMVNVHVKHDSQKRGTWSQAKPVLHFDVSSQTVTVPGAKGKYIQAATEDVRYAVYDANELATAVQYAIDQCDRAIEDAVDDIHEPSDSDEDGNPSQIDLEQEQGENDNLQYYDALDEPDHRESEEEQEPNTNGDRNQEQYVDALTYLPTPSVPASTHNMDLRERNPVTYTADIELQPGSSLTSSEQHDLDLYHDRFKTKEFLGYEAEGLPSHILHNAFVTEQDGFLKTCTKIHVSKVPETANVISSHVLYKIKELDDGSRICKARIAPHGNKDKEKNSLRTDSASCPPLGMRVLLSLCTLLKFFVSKIDIKAAFLQSGKAMRDVFVIPPRECLERSFYWHLNVATYGLTNANAKWQVHSDNTVLRIGLSAAVYIPQLFYLKVDGALALIAAKIVDDILVGGREDLRLKFISQLCEAYDVGTIVHLPGTFKFFSLSIEQDEDFVVRISSEERLQNIECYSLPTPRRKNPSASLSAVELFSFQSVNGSLSFLGMTVSPFAAFASSYLQQTSGNPSVHNICCQMAMLRVVKRLGTFSTFRKPPRGTHDLSVLIFADAARPSAHAQIGFVGGLLIGTPTHGSVLHTVSWASHLSKRPVKSSGSGEVLAAGDAIDTGKVIAKVYSSLLDMDVHLYVIVDSKDLYDSLSTCRTPEDKSIRADVQLLRYNFETHQLNKLIWIPGNANPADALTKRDSALSETLQLMLFDGTVPVTFDISASRSSDASLG